MRNESFNKIKSFIEKKYQYLKVIKRDNGFVVEGLAFDRTCSVVVNKYLLDTCQNIIHFLDRSEKRYIINNRLVGLYEILDLYAESEPKNIERAKGLGALSPYELGKSTLDPDNRKLLRYTVEDIVKEIEEMRKINDDKYSLIKDLDLSQFEF
jgi:DNA gyrase/topoisomerase IV subunit B